MSSVPESLMNSDNHKLIEKFMKLPQDIRITETKSDPSIFTDKSQMADILARQNQVDSINRGTFRHTIGKHLNNSHTK